MLWFCIGKALQTHCWDGVGGQCFLPRDHTRTDLSHCGMMPSRGWAVLFSPKSPWGGLGASQEPQRGLERPTTCCGLAGLAKVSARLAGAAAP